MTPHELAEDMIKRVVDHNVWSTPKLKEWVSWCEANVDENATYPIQSEDGKYSFVCCKKAYIALIEEAIKRRGDG